MRIMDDDPRFEAPYISPRHGDSLREVMDKAQEIGAYRVADGKEEYQITIHGTYPTWITEETLSKYLPIPKDETLLDFTNRIAKIKLKDTR